MAHVNRGRDDQCLNERLHRAVEENPKRHAVVPIAAHKSNAAAVKAFSKTSAEALGMIILETVSHLDVCKARSVATAQRHEAQCQARCQRIAFPVLGHCASAAAHTLLPAPRTRPPPYLLQHDLCCQPAAPTLLPSCCLNNKSASGTGRMPHVQQTKAAQAVMFRTQASPSSAPGSIPLHMMSCDATEDGPGSCWLSRLLLQARASWRVAGYMGPPAMLPAQQGPRDSIDSSSASGRRPSERGSRLESQQARHAR